MARLSKRLKQEWDFFISPETGRRTYNDLCRKCRNECNKVKVDIYFTAIGLFDVPTEQELLKTAEEIKNRKQLTDKSA